jgi:ribosome recycling factor
MSSDIKRSAEERMDKTIHAFEESISRMRTGRASTGLLEHLMVSYYGVDTPLSQVATVNVLDARTLTVMPWEDSMITPIEKAIQTLGLNPNSSGKNIRVPMPPLTEESRKSFVKMVRDDAENARVAIRNIRRDANQEFKELAKEKLISEDEEHRGQENVQKLTDLAIKKLDVLLETKESELMQF